MSMIEKDLQRLIGRDSRDLTGLESDIWKREAQIRGNRAGTLRLASLQAGVMAIAVISSAAVGSAVAMRDTGSVARGSFFAAETLAPSALLFGHRR